MRGQNDHAARSSSGHVSFRELLSFAIEMALLLASTPSLAPKAGLALRRVTTRRTSSAPSVVTYAAGTDAVPAKEARAAAEATKVVKRKGAMDTMGFGGWAPEVINGRVAQLAFVAGVGAELATGETLPAQFHDHVFSLAFVSVLVALASFMPDAQAKKYTAEPSTKGAFGPFSPGKEMLHGRLAMIGLAAAFAMELHSGTPLFVR